MKTAAQNRKHGRCTVWGKEMFLGYTWVSPERVSLRVFCFVFLFAHRFSFSLCCWRTPSTHLCPLNSCPLTLPEAVTVNLDPSPARLWQWRYRTRRTAPRTTGRWRSSGTHSRVCCHGCGCEVCVSLSQSPCFCSCLRVGSSCHSLPVSHCQFNPFAGLGSVCRFCTGSEETNEV